MAARRMEMLLTFIVAITLCTSRVMADSSSNSCSNTLISMSSCLDYVQGNTTKPSSTCCTKLTTVAASQPKCLCQVLNGDSSLGITINKTQAQALPGACNLKGDSSSLCGAASPSGSTSSSSSGSSGSNNGTSDGNSKNFTFSLLFFTLFVASSTVATIL
ncbi:hypothetical protein ACFE04_011496 [Oxalis oulophora]